MSINSKIRKKNNRSTQRALIVKHLAGKYDVTVQMIYQALRNERVSAFAEEIIKEYNHQMVAIDNILK